MTTTASHNTGHFDETLRLRVQDLGENPTARIPVALCLDVSGSMAGEPLAELNHGVHAFYRALSEDMIAAHSAEIAVVAFAERAQLLVEFESLRRATPPTLTINEKLGYSTDLGAGVELALTHLAQRQAEIEYAGVDYHRPFIVIMSDGAPTTQTHIQVAAQTRAIEAAKKLKVLPVGVGPQAHLDVLGQFSGRRPAVRLKGLCFAEFFQWLSESVIAVSQSQPGDQPPPAPPISGWAEL